MARISKKNWITAEALKREFGDRIKYVFLGFANREGFTEEQVAKIATTPSEVPAYQVQAWQRYLARFLPWRRSLSPIDTSANGCANG